MPLRRLSRSEYLNDVAKRLDVSPEKLSGALKGAYLDQLDKAVSDGRLTQAQADALKNIKYVATRPAK